MAQMLLHGVVDAKILEADLSVTSNGQLRPTRKTVMKKRVFSWIKKLSFCNTYQLENAIGLGGTAGKLYATVDIDKARVGRTRMVNPSNGPAWNESFHIYCAHDATHPHLIPPRPARVSPPTAARRPPPAGRLPASPRFSLSPPDPPTPVPARSPLHLAATLAVG